MASYVLTSSVEQAFMIKVTTPMVAALVGKALITVEPIPRNMQPKPSAFTDSLKHCTTLVYFAAFPNLSACSLDFTTSIGYVKTHERMPLIPPAVNTKRLLSLPPPAFTIHS